SRRSRHTRWPRDWSSDVCSSDLSGAGLFAVLGMGPAYVAIVCLYITATALTLCIVAPAKPHAAGEAASEALQRSPLRDLKEGVRSEERSVGKEGGGVVWGVGRKH